MNTEYYGIELLCAEIVVGIVIGYILGSLVMIVKKFGR